MSTPHNSEVESSLVILSTPLRAYFGGAVALLLTLLDLRKVLRFHPPALQFDFLPPPGSMIATTAFFVGAIWLALSVARLSTDRDERIYSYCWAVDAGISAVAVHVSAHAFSLQTVRPAIWLIATGAAIRIALRLKSKREMSSTSHDRIERDNESGRGFSRADEARLDVGLQSRTRRSVWLVRGLLAASAFAAALCLLQYLFWAGFYSGRVGIAPKEVLVEAERRAGWYLLAFSVFEGITLIFAWMAFDWSETDQTQFMRFFFRALVSLGLMLGATFLALALLWAFRGFIGPGSLSLMT